MKSNYVSNMVAAFLFTAFAAQVMAQPQITSAEMIPDIGTEHPMSEAVYLAQPGGGANLTFAFGDMIAQSSLDISVVNVSEVPQGQDFDGDYAFKRESENSLDYQVIAHTDLAQQVLALINEGGMGNTIEYLDPADLLRFPMSYGDSYSDIYESEYPVNILGQEFLYSQTAHMVVTYDAYGELILPSGAYEDIMRVTVMYEATVEIYLDGNLQETLPFDQFDYYYYQDGNPMYLCLFSRMVPNTGQVQESASFYDPASSGQGQEIPGVSLSVYPNPASNRLSLALESEKVQTLNISLYDTNGSLIKSPGNRNVVFDSRFDVDLSGIESGLYILRLTDNNGNSVEKRISVAY